MFTAPARRWCISKLPCVVHKNAARRSYLDQRRGIRNGKSGQSDAQRSVRTVESPSKDGRKTATSPLMAQLFPERYRYNPPKEVHDIPQLPLPAAVRPKGVAPTHVHVEDNTKIFMQKSRDDSRSLSPAAQRLREEMSSQPPETAVLVLRNASPNLTEDDFKRVIPRGSHIEGWTLEQGDILKVIPGRDFTTLAPLNYYYILFRTAASATEYQGHVTKLHRLAVKHAPRSLESPVAIGLDPHILGSDVHAAMQSYSLVPPSQQLSLRKLRRPFTHVVDSIVRNEGLDEITQRKDRMPHEARLTFEGPQLSLGDVRGILYRSGKQRALSWSGNEEEVPKVSKWEPVNADLVPSPMSRRQSQGSWLDRLGTARRKAEAFRIDDPPDDNFLAERGSDESQDLHSQMQEHGDTAYSEGRKDNLDGKRPGRGRQAVYIVGFPTEEAVQSFVHYWHRRPMKTRRSDDLAEESGDLPPVAHVQLLW